ncbi:ras-GEF domain-containing family member 1B-like [Hetaerina americana]|uniref:ras-GEF domain-containing family member 1B-like n=1 Tax=Hetaerina americana TaxID=62018 RepID=UPI003A7F2DE3
MAMYYYASKLSSPRTSPSGRAPGRPPAAQPPCSHCSAAANLPRRAPPYDIHSAAAASSAPPTPPLATPPVPLGPPHHTDDVPPHHRRPPGEGSAASPTPPAPTAKGPVAARGGHRVHAGNKQVSGVRNQPVPVHRIKRSGIGSPAAAFYISLPQTPQSSKSFGALLNGGGGGTAAAAAAENSGSSLESMHDAAPDSDNSLVYRDGGNLVSGSLEALVQHMVPTADYYPDRAYLFAFLLSARLFIKPHKLLGEVCSLCDTQQHLGEQRKGAQSKERLGRFVPHLVQLLAEWTETFPYDFRDERVMGHVRSLTQKCVAIDPSVRREVSALLQALLLRLTALEKYEEFLQKVNAESSALSLDCLSSTDVTELCLSPALLAQQLTHIELERLSYIGPEEFVQAFAKENPNVETSFKDMKKTRNLESYVQWFNRLSYLVATEVCKHVKKKQRVKVMEYWIETARECFNIGNFNSLMAIIAGLNMSPISRLKKTWSKVPSAKFSILEHQMDPSSNFSSYRSTLKAAMWRSAGATDERQRIVIPFFSLLVKDLYFLNEGCSNKLPNGHINFEKFWQLAKQVTEFITWKQVTCPFEKNPKVITFLQASPVLTENALALASFECEPPDNNHEKERYKTLRAELNS